MADFSPSGVADLPAVLPTTLQHGDPRVLGWLREWVQEGDAINRADPSYETIGRAQEYIAGEQLSREYRNLRYLPQVTINETRKALQAHVSTLTDIRPLAGWRAAPEYTPAADQLNKYLLYEWITRLLDLDLGDCIKYALAGGTGDLVIDWDPHVPGGGAHAFSARDPRDTLALRPGVSRSIQDWEGVCLREETTLNALRGMYPSQAALFTNSSDSALGSIMGRFRTMASRLISPADPLDQLQPASVHRRKRSGGILLYKAYFRDRTVNLTAKAIPLGTPGTNWASVVPPGAPLYPRGRLLVATDTVILYDGPNIYWHGLFPICRLKLWSVPWQFLGVPLFNDLLPVQDALNDTVNDVRLAIRQWMDPDILYNRTAVSESTMRLMDPRRPGKKIKVNPGFGEPYAKQNGPNPQVITQAIEFWQLLTQKFADLSGTANLSALLQLRQLPSGDTMEKYYEAMTPEIRTEARMIEAFLRDASDLIKTNYLQFLTSAKRIQVLGEGGAVLNDFDVDPNTVVPALLPGQPGYTPELDARQTTREQRALFFTKQFAFIVAPNSVLNINAQETKMMRFQLARMGYLDFWSLHEVLETPNVGAPPQIPLPPVEPPPEGVIQGMLGQLLSQPGAVGAMAGAQAMIPQYTDPASGRTFLLDPGSGQLLELRAPLTITERLQAQALLGIGQTASPAGRKASGQEAPQMEEKTDEGGGSRQTVTESKH